MIRDPDTSSNSTTCWFFVFLKSTSRAFQKFRLIFELTVFTSIFRYGSAYAPAYGPEQVISQHVEINRAIPVPVYRTVAVGVPQPVPVQVPYPVPVIKTVAYPVEKPVPYPVDKPYPVTVEKKVPVPVDRPYPVPVYKIKHIYHEPKWSKWLSGW